MRSPIPRKHVRRIRLAYAITLPAMLFILFIVLAVVLVVTRDATLALPLLLPFVVLSKLVERCMIWYSDDAELRFLKSKKDAIERLAATYWRRRD